MPVTHRTQSAVADAGTAGEIGPSEWNETHKMDMVATFGGYTVLSNVGATADAIALTKGLGICVIDMTGIDTVEFRVFYNKIGTGTLTWQLWNQTDGTAIGTIADAAAAADNKLGSNTFTGLALTGVKVLRVRAFSSVAGDDPVYYGASALFRDT